jgi:hypothetical protein
MNRFALNVTYRLGRAIHNFAKIRLDLLLSALQKSFKQIYEEYGRDMKPLCHIAHDHLRTVFETTDPGKLSTWKVFWSWERLDTRNTIYNRVRKGVLCLSHFLRM